MKIMWLQDLNIFEYSGGAQETDKMMFNEGIKRGHEIKLITPRNFKLLEEPYDILIISNCISFPRETFQYVIGRKYVLFHHDYWFCKFRGFFPMLPKCKNCMNKPFWSSIINNAELNIFLSPLHYKMHLYVFPELEKLETLITPSPINVNQFNIRKNITRNKDTVLYVGALTKYKGTDNILNYAKQHPELKFTFIGPYSDEFTELIIREGHSYYKQIPHNKLPEIYNSFEYVIHLPNNPLPFERSPIAEGFLCGCKIIANKNVGCLSYKWFRHRETARNNIAKSPQNFWNKIEKII